MNVEEVPLLNPLSLDHERRETMAEALERGGAWLDWPSGVAPPAPMVFWGNDIDEKMLVPHRTASRYCAVGLICIRDAVVIDEAFLADGSGAPYLSDSLFPEYLNHWIENGERPRARRPLSQLEEVRLSGLTALVHHCHSHIFGHWLVEGLPKLLYLKSCSLPVDRFIVQRDVSPHIVNWIKRIAPAIEVVSYDPATQFARCERLVAPTLACSVRWPRYVFNPKLNMLLDQVAPRRPATRLLYLDREWRGDYHWIVNADEVRETARSMGFEVFYPAEESIDKQIEAFASARVIAADYGSALHNSVFAPSCTRVLAFNWVTYIQSRIAQLRGQRIGFQMGETGKSVVHEGYRLNIDDAKRAFEAALKA